MVEKLLVGTQVLATTDSDVDAVTEPTLAEIVLEPCDTPVTTPIAATTIATAGLPDDQVAILVTLAVVPSENVPVAASCLDVPMPVTAGSGVMAIDSTMAGITFRVVLPETVPSVAVISVEPGATDVASPVVAFIVAEAEVPEVHLTLLRSAVLESENVPVALNC